jgi:hypothetical protein
MYKNFSSEIQKGRDYSKDVGINAKIILEWLSRKYGGKVWTGFVSLGTGTSGGHCEHGNEPSVSIKGEEFLD